MRKKLQIRADEVRDGDYLQSSGLSWSKVEGEPVRERGEIAVFTKTRCEFYWPHEVVTVEREV